MITLHPNPVAFVSPWGLFHLLLVASELPGAVFLYCILLGKSLEFTEKVLLRRSVQMCPLFPTMPLFHSKIIRKKHSE